MENQNYSNHVRYYTAHHFVFYPILLLLLGISTYFIFSKEDQAIWIFVTALLLMLGWLSFMVRQHYGLGNQNRIIRLEMRFRYYVLTGERLESLENQLSFGQVAALRFASDAEFPQLVQQAVSKNLSPDDIKKAIVSWIPDHMRR